MTWKNRLRLWGGVLLTIIVVCALTLVFNQRQTQVNSDAANVTAITYQIGADYGGTVIKQDVEQGDRVKKGQELFTVQSLQLKSELRKGLELENTDTFKVNPARGTITYFAARDGMITKLDARMGNSIPNGTAMAEITVFNDRYVTAYLHLTPRDYARVEKGADVKVLMPNNDAMTGKVADIAVETDDAGGAKTVLKVDCPDLVKFDEVGLANPGTPVVATVKLRDDGPLAGVNDLLVDFLRQIGLK